MNRLETVELEYVVTLAEELSFTAAAARLGMAQPALSRAIGRIERRLGVALFVRTTRSVALSEPGRVFVAAARTVLADLDRVVHATRSLDRHRPLVIALRAGAGSGLLARALGSWDGAAVRVEPTNDPIGTVRGNIADLALACSTDDSTGLNTDIVTTQPTVALVARGHRLADRHHVTLTDVAAARGFQAKCPPIGLDEIIDRVALTGLVVLAAADITDRLSADVRAVPVDDAPFTTLCLVRRPGRNHQAIAAFIRHVNHTTAQP